MSPAGFAGGPPAVIVGGYGGPPAVMSPAGFAGGPPAVIVGGFGGPPAVMSPAGFAGGFGGTLCVRFFFTKPNHICGATHSLILCCRIYA
jgi:hypothetical protein